METTLAQWQNRWASQRDELVRRLEVIDSQLQELAPADATLRLAIVGPHDESAVQPILAGSGAIS